MQSKKEIKQGVCNECNSSNTFYFTAMHRIPGGILGANTLECEDCGAMRQEPYLKGKELRHWRKMYNEKVI